MMIKKRHEMKQEVLHDNLLKAIREKLPYEENLASVLGNLLCIGKEAIYRRLRGDVPFTLLETAQISKEMNISIDYWSRFRLKVGLSS